MSDGKALVPYARCGAKTRQGASCKQVAGARTPHTGQGRCWLHGGRTPIKHGRYSTIKRDDIRQLVEQHADDPDPLNTFPELALARALLQDYIERYDQWREAFLAWHASFTSGETAPKPRQVLDLADAVSFASDVTKIVERIEKARAENAISRPELLRVMDEMARVVKAHVDELDTQRRIREGWLAIRL